MLILVGNHWRGKTDHVVGLFHVATYFGTIFFLPFVPEQSFLMVEALESSGQPRCQIPIPCSWKSVLLAYIRGGLLAWIFLCSGLLLVGLVDPGERRQDRSLASFLATVIGLTLLLLLATYCRWFTRARPRRALQLAQLANIDPEMLALRFVGPDQVAEFLAAHAPPAD